MAACVVFAEAGVDAAVLEVGLGGRSGRHERHEARHHVRTGIGLDHCRILGDTLELIAAEKAAVIKAGQRGCVLGVGTWAPSSVEDVFLARCAGAWSRCCCARQVPPRPRRGRGGHHGRAPGAAACRLRRDAPPGRAQDPLALDVATPRAAYEGLTAARPLYQAANIACAVTLAEGYLGRRLDEAALARSVLACPTPGRFDALSARPLHLIDAAHNPQSIRTFLDSLAEAAPDVEARPTLLCAVLADKDVDGIVGLLAPAFPRVVVTATSSPRALPAPKLADAFRSRGVEPAATYPAVAEAVGALAGVAYVAVGSITLAGEVAGLLGR